jgi:hypothetical protein
MIVEILSFVQRSYSKLKRLDTELIALDTKLDDLNVAPKIGLVPRTQVTTSISGTADSGLVSVVNFAGAGHLGFAHRHLVVSGVGGDALVYAQFKVIVDGAELFDTGEVSMGNGTIDEDLSREVYTTSAIFRLMANGGGGFDFKSSLILQHRIRGAGGTNPAATVTTTLEWEHE